jgi:hypothetical protein
MISFQDVGPGIKWVSISLSILCRPRYENTELWINLGTVVAETMDHLECLTFSIFPMLRDFITLSKVDFPMIEWTAPVSINEDCTGTSFSAEKSEIGGFFLLPPGLLNDAEPESRNAFFFFQHSFSIWLFFLQ